MRHAGQDMGSPTGLTLRLKSAQLSGWARGLCNTDFWHGNDPEISTNSARRVLGFTSHQEYGQQLEETM